VMFDYLHDGGIARILNRYFAQSRRILRPA